MKKEQRWAQLILISIGLILFVLTYLYYPSIKTDKLVKEHFAKKDSEATTGTDETTTFENLEYKGLYDFDKPFTVKSNKAYILAETPEIVFMKNMKVILNLSDGRIVTITSDEGRYNKETYDCFFETNVIATDGDTQITGDFLNLLATENVAKIYNDVILNHSMGTLQADEIDYDFETKHFKVLMYDNKAINMKIIQ